jgi:hypothetical protein
MSVSSTRFTPDRGRYSLMALANSVVNKASDEGFERLKITAVMYDIAHVCPVVSAAPHVFIEVSAKQC